MNLETPSLFKTSFEIQMATESGKDLIVDAYGRVDFACSVKWSSIQEGNILIGHEQLPMVEHPLDVRGEPVFIPGIRK